MIYFYTIFRFFLQLAFHIPDVSVLIKYQLQGWWDADTIVGEDTRIPNPEKYISATNTWVLLARVLGSNKVQRNLDGNN